MLAVTGPDGGMCALCGGLTSTIYNWLSLNLALIWHKSDDNRNSKPISATTIVESKSFQLKYKLNCDMIWNVVDISSPLRSHCG